MVLYHIGFLLAFVIPSLSILGYLLGGAWNFLTLGVVFVVVPILDPILGRRLANFSDSANGRLKEDLFFRLVTWLYVPMQLGLVIWGGMMVGSGTMTVLETIGFVLSMGTVTGGVGITVAHELGHRSGQWEQNLAKTLLMSVCYMHFFIEHNQGHHSRVATPQDPASARFGESLYRFYFRTVVHSFTHAWALEKKRLGRKGLSTVSLRTRMIRYMLAPLLFASLIGLLAGPLGVVFFLAQSVVAFTLLEMVNYVEHYGLARKELGSGRYERVTPLHSWNASEMLTNFLLFNLQRHSDHHAFANRRYQVLRHCDESPQLPTGYAGMILLAMVPPLWRRVMDPKVEEARLRINMA